MKLKFGFDNEKNPILQPTIIENRPSRVIKQVQSPSAPALGSLNLFGKQLDAIKELENLVGLENVKNLVKEITAYVKIERLREQEGLAIEPMVLHMIFKGNLGQTTMWPVWKCSKKGILQKHYRGRADCQNTLDTRTTTRTCE